MQAAPNTFLRQKLTIKVDTLIAGPEPKTCCHAVRMLLLHPAQEHGFLPHLPTMGLPAIMRFS